MGPRATTAGFLPATSRRLPTAGRISRQGSVVPEQRLALSRRPLDSPGAGPLSGDDGLAQRENAPVSRHPARPPAATARRRPVPDRFRDVPAHPSRIPGVAGLQGSIVPLYRHVVSENSSLQPRDEPSSPGNEAFSPENEPSYACHVAFGRTFIALCRASARSKAGSIASAASRISSCSRRPCRSPQEAISGKKEAGAGFPRGKAPAPDRKRLRQIRNGRDRAAGSTPPASRSGYRSR